MKTLLFICLFTFCVFGVKAQNNEYEIKVISKKYQSVKGKLQKVTPEGIAIEDYKGNYLIFRTEEIVRIKVRRRGLTIGEAAGTGTLAGLCLGGAIWSIDKEGQSFNEMAKLTGVLTVSGAAIGTITGIVAELSNTKLNFSVDGNADKTKKNYKKLEKYLNVLNMQHVNAQL